MVSLLPSARLPTLACRRSTDYARVRAVAHALWHELAEPALPEPVYLDDRLLDRFVFIEVLADGESAGFFVIHGHDFHVMLLPFLRGRAALRAAAACFEWIRRELGLTNLTAFSHAGRRDARWYAHQIGFRDTARNPRFDHYTKAL